jgi:hypothetical protein
VSPAIAAHPEHNAATIITAKIVGFRIIGIPSFYV